MPEIFKAAGADFAVFYLRHFKAIYRVCYAFLKNAEDAEDCTEDVFVRAMQANPSLENERHERAWLTTTAMNLCKDRLKHWWRQKVVPLDETMEDTLGVSDKGHEVLDAVMALPVSIKRSCGCTITRATRPTKLPRCCTAPRPQCETSCATRVGN